MHYINRLIFAFLLCATPLLPAAALAHSNHQEPLSETQLLEQAKRHVRNMVADSEYFPEITLDASWNGELVSRVERKSARSLMLAVENKQTNKVVFLYMDYYGGLRSANFSGDFKGMK